MMPTAAGQEITLPDPDGAAGYKNMQQLILLRWIAVLGQIATIGTAYFLFEIPLPIDIMLTLVLALAAFNAISVLRLQARRPVTNMELLVALLVDVGILTALLYCSGGTTNPFIFLFLLQAALAAVLLQPWSTWVVVGVTACCVAGLALASQPLDLPLDHDMGLTSPYIQGLLLCFVLNAALLVVFITRINHNLRDRDQHLAALRQRAVEEEHIVRMGLLASGAAHELGTPLSTLAVILGDWRHMPPFTDDPELGQEISEMQIQVARCKAIVTGILMSAGETRGDSPTETTVHQFLEFVVEQWRATHGAAKLVYDNHFGPDVRIISDSALQQMVGNVLDNALEASPAWQRLIVDRQDDTLMLTIQDAGPGFSPDILAQLGKPYQSSKGQTGRGLGLFLSLNVARTLGGRLSAQNLLNGGAAVTITLPLSTLSLSESQPEAIASTTVAPPQAP
ncbi:HAMP domain-containing histidine kinase [Pusillimonas sp. CC-YST705]|uniref:histidine kinase n=2 Tax=Mesopusillimonas faecipullorum TaxID=2755040 RepID=A0ABS8CGL9_9BURK|nr:HAMP domain-containing histidine kinase [Mesopusillimonas faecipullorum]